MAINRCPQVQKHNEDDVYYVQTETFKHTSKCINSQSRSMAPNVLKKYYEVKLRKCWMCCMELNGCNVCLVFFLIALFYM